MFDAHVKQRNFIKSGLIMFTRKGRFNEWSFAGNYRPELCKAIMAVMPNAFAF